MAIRIEKTCQQCGATFVLNRNSLAAVQEFCGRECGNTSRRLVTLRSRYRTTSVPLTHPIASKSGNVLEHRLILWNKIGPGSHACHHCGTTVTWTRQEVLKVGMLVGDHLDGNTHNNDPANLVPSCQRCNIKKRHDHVRDDEPHRDRGGKARERGTWKACKHCAKSFVALVSNKGYEPLYCSRACVSAGKRKAATKPCAGCGVDFYSSNATKRKYCGAACYHAVNKGRKRRKRPVTAR